MLFGADLNLQGCKILNSHIIIEIITGVILLTPLFLIKNIEKAIIVVYIIATLLLLFNNIFILQNDFITTGWHILMDIGVVSAVILISQYFNNLIIKQNK